MIITYYFIDIYVILFDISSDQNILFHFYINISVMLNDEIIHILTFHFHKRFLKH